MFEKIKGYFDEVSKSWNKGRSIDILHIDGRHEYENVTADYNDWKHLVKEDGIVLFHDCYVWDQEKFGVYKLLNELTDFKFKGYFETDAGLGIATNNQAIFTAIVIHFPKFKIGGNIVPPDYALPSYFIASAPTIVSDPLNIPSAPIIESRKLSTNPTISPVSINNTRIVIDFSSWELTSNFSVYTKHIEDNIVHDHLISGNNNWNSLFKGVIVDNQLQELVYQKVLIDSMIYIMYLFELFVYSYIQH